MFVNHILATLPELPEYGPYLYEYVIAGNGVFVRACRPGLEALIPVKVFGIAGWKNVMPYVRLSSRVPVQLIRRALASSVEALPNEALFWFALDEQSNAWTIYRPRQIRTPTSVRPVDPEDPYGAIALVDLHSHNVMRPFFSTTDDRDETGLRIYAVIGSINVHSNRPPRIRVRVGIFGHTYPVPASGVYELPPYLVDAYSMDEYEEDVADDAQ
jgi:PRTRC genetic system protein A